MTRLTPEAEAEIVQWAEQLHTRGDVGQSRYLRQMLAEVTALRVRLREMEIERDAAIAHATASATEATALRGDLERNVRRTLPALGAHAGDDAT